MSLTQQLYDAQVAWILDQLLGDGLADVVAADVETALGATADIRLADLVDPAEVKRVARALFAGVPGSTAADALVTQTAKVVHRGPDEPFALGDLLEREHLEPLLDNLLQSTRLAEEVLDDLAKSPLMAAVASRFVGRLVGEVLAANKAAASKIPGLGGLVSLGSGAASMVMGAADKQFEAILGGGATFAARRLNKIVLETLRDPTTRDAVLQVWDMYADQPLPAPKDYIREQDLLAFVGVLHAAATSAAASEPVGQLVDAVIDGFFEVYGDYGLPTLLEELEIGRDVLVADLTAFVGGAARTLHEAGVLEGAVRHRLAGFWSSPTVTGLLGG